MNSHFTLFKNIYIYRNIDGGPSTVCIKIVRSEKGVRGRFSSKEVFIVDKTEDSDLYIRAKRNSKDIYLSVIHEKTKIEEREVRYRNTN